MKILNDVKVTVNERGDCSLKPAGDEDGVIGFRRPSNSEQNNYEAAKYESKGRKGKLKDKTFAARVALAEKCATALTNFEDEKGAITLEEISRMPVKILSDAYFVAFEDTDPDIGDEDELGN